MSDDLRDFRLAKLNDMREAGVQPFPDRFDKTHTSVEARALEDGDGPVRVAGRIMAIRSFGSLTFVKIRDFEGDIQIAFNKKNLGEEEFKAFGKRFDMGDYIGAEGERFTTKKGEPTVRVASYVMLSKSLLPLPEKWHGITDQEARYRQRYLDLIMNPESLTRFKLRTRVVRSIRNFLDDHGFEEVTIPVLQPKPSGALATPFKADYHALDMPVYMSIAPETYLKRLVVGGYERVYEFARCFRNEGVDHSHLPDFTMLEYYVAFWSFEENMAFTEKLFPHVFKEVTGVSVLKLSDGKEIDLGNTPWPRYSFRELLLEKIDVDIDQLETADDLRAVIKEKGIELDGMEKMGRGTLIDQLYKKTVRPNLEGPLFLTHHPIDISPLARRSDDNPKTTDRFQLVITGWEIVNAYSELIDPIDQRERLEAQASLNAEGDEEAMVMDEDYLLAMEHGMPPMSGWGMGIDRFCALITGVDNLRDMVLFPLLKQKES